MQYISLVEGSSLLIYAATIINYPILSTRSTYHFLQLGFWIVATQNTTWNVLQMIEVTKVYLRFCSQPFVVVVPCGAQTFRHWTIIGANRILSGKKNLLAKVCDTTLGKQSARVASRQRAFRLLGTQRMTGPFEAGGEFYKERTGFCCLLKR